MKLLTYIGGFILLVFILNKWIPPSPPEYIRLNIPQHDYNSTELHLCSSEDEYCMIQSMKH